MKFAINIPPFEELASAQTLAVLAHQAEQAGWDGFFLWDHMIFDDFFHPIADPWVSLAAMSVSTEDMRLGTMITPLARRRPWKLARETVSLDRLSNGRLTLGVGLGDPAQWEYSFFGEDSDPKHRAKKLDEGLEILTGLWTGQPFSFQGEYYQLDEVVFSPKPIQEPRIPIWCGGYWPRKAPFRRAARWDGVYPGGLDGILSPDDWHQILAYIALHRTSDTDFDAVHSDFLPQDLGQARDAIQSYAEVGVTWWVIPADPWSAAEDWTKPWSNGDADRIIEIVRQGPPK